MSFFSKKPTCDSVQTAARVLTAQIRQTITRESRFVAAAESQTFRAIQQTQTDKLDTEVQKYLLGNRKISGLEMVLEALSRVSGGGEALVSSDRPPEHLKQSLKDVMGSGRALGLTSYTDFESKILSKIYSAETIQALCSQNGIDPKIRKALLDKTVTDDDFDMVIKTVGRNNGAPDESIEAVLKKPVQSSRTQAQPGGVRLSHSEVNPSLQIDPSKGYQEKPSLFIPVPVPAFDKCVWPSLLAEIERVTSYD
jgi:hypothetical protein